MKMENPLVGSFNRERTMLIFRQRSLEFFGSIVGMGLGLAMLIAAFLPIGSGPSMSDYLLTFGGLFFGVSLWAFLTFRCVKFDLRRRAYAWRERLGLFPRNVKGPLSDIRCLELNVYQGIFPTGLMQSVAPQTLAAPVQYGQLYVLRLHWNNPQLEPIALEHVQLYQSYGAVDGSLVNFAKQAMSYAQALQTPLYSAVPIPGLQPMAYRQP